MPYQIDIRNLNPVVQSPQRIIGTSRLKLWLESDQHIYQTAGGAFAGSNGDQIQQILDLSGNGNHPTQTTGSSAPVRANNSLGYFPALSFDGVDDFLGINSRLIAENTGFVMMVLNLKTALVAQATSFGTADTSVTTKYIRLSPYVAAGNSRVYQRNADTLDQVNLASGTPAINTPTILTIGSDGATYLGANNGTALTIGTVGSGANTGDWGSDTTTPNVTTIGCHRINSNSAFLEFHMLACVVVDGAYTTTEMNACRDYFRNIKYRGLIY